jgi:hypothetical protein
MIAGRPDERARPGGFGMAFTDPRSAKRGQSPFQNIEDLD